MVQPAIDDPAAGGLTTQPRPSHVVSASFGGLPNLMAKPEDQLAGQHYSEDQLARQHY